MTFGMNKIIIVFTSTATAVFGVYFKLQSFVFMPVFGLNNGMVPIVSYNYGARNKKRLMQVFRFSGLCAVIMGTVLTLLMVVARQSIIRMFINDADVVNYGIQMIIALQLSGPVIGIMFLCINTIQGMGKALPSLILTVCRQGLIFIPLIFILPHYLGLQAVEMCQATADLLTFILAIPLTCSVLNEMKRKQAEQL